MFTSTKKNTRCRQVKAPMALKQRLKDSPCSTEWIKVCYKRLKKRVLTVWSRLNGTRAIEILGNDQLKNKPLTFAFCNIALKQSVEV